MSIMAAHPHIVNGKSQSCSQIIHHQCPAQHTIYIPQDPNLHIVLVVHHNNLPHNHPMPHMLKASLEAKATYEECVEAASTTSATVQMVDNGENCHHASPSFHEITRLQQPQRKYFLEVNPQASSTQHCMTSMSNTQLSSL